MIFSLEALYTLHIFNDYSNDLAFLPLPIEPDENRKEALQRVLAKGFEDLKEMGLIVHNQPTEQCAEYGAYLKEYHEASYHCSVDQRLFYAPGVDEFKRMAVILMQMDDNQFQLDRAGTAVFLAFLMEFHPVLQGVDERVKDYIQTQWQVEALMRLIVRHGNDEAIRIQVRELSTDTNDLVYYTNDNHLYEYDMKRQLQRSLDSDQLKKQIFRLLKVRL